MGKIGNLRINMGLEEKQYVLGRRRLGAQKLLNHCKAESSLYLFVDLVEVPIDLCGSKCLQELSTQVPRITFY